MTKAYHKHRRRYVTYVNTADGRVDNKGVETRGRGQASSLFGEGRLIDWLSMVLRRHQHNIGYTADGFYRSDDPTKSVKALKEGG